MKVKTIATILSVLLIGGCSVFAGDKVMGYESFGKSGVSALTEVMLDAGNGYILGEALYVDSTTNTTLTISKPHKKTTMAAAESADTSLAIHVSSSNVVSGFTLTTDDYLIVGGVKTKISALGAYTAATRQQAVTAATAVTAADNDVIYVIDASNDITFPVTAAADQSNLRNIFSGYKNMPVYLSLPIAGGTMVIGGTYSVRK